ncbi:tumor protein p53-inducible protein 11-like isoform X2 [Liolophura sinensis]|uniref:tumor protein p53-inducible protein 11-like isoform X2 n=1 Tax=Liolophura sinensis TaxID=3198878 RepID=UPI00315939FE
MEMPPPPPTSSVPGKPDEEGRRSTYKLKHSSGDLHSRLKTRKLLGVGETDDGDVHRSKLSQILGHNDQLYVRLPWGLRMWQFMLAITFTVVAIWALMFPAHLYEVLFGTQQPQESLLPVRLYGIAILCISLVYWSTLQSADREIIRMILLVSMVYFGLQTFMILVVSFAVGSSENFFLLCFGCVSIVLISTAYHWAIGGKLVSIRRSTSNKDLSTSPQSISPSKDPNQKEHIN